MPGARSRRPANTDSRRTFCGQLRCKLWGTVLLLFAAAIIVAQSGWFLSACQSTSLLAFAAAEGETASGAANKIGNNDNATIANGWADMAAELSVLRELVHSDPKTASERLRVLWQQAQSEAQRTYVASALPSTQCIDDQTCKSYREHPDDCGLADTDGFSSMAICCACQEARSGSTASADLLITSSTSVGSLGSSDLSTSGLSTTSRPTAIGVVESVRSPARIEAISQIATIKHSSGNVCQALGSRDGSNSNIKLPSLSYHINNDENDHRVVRELDVPPLKDADNIWDAGLSVVRGNRTLLHGMLLRLWAKKTVKIVVYGGSMTKGVGCAGEGQGAVNPPCAWPARFVSRILRAFPDAAVKLDNHALGGCGLDCLLQEFILKQVQAEEPPDLILLDFGQNSNGQGDIEKFIRVAHLFLPRTQLATIWTGARATRRFKGDKLNAGALATNLFASRHYGVPILSFYHAEDYYFDNGGKYIDMWTRDGHHPDYRTHAYFADLLTRWFNVELRALDACELDQQALSVAELNRPVLNEASKLDLTEDTSWIPPINKKFDVHDLGTCLFPLASHLARSPGPDSPRRSASPAWRLYEDRPGKPGWIGNVTGEKITFPVRFSKKPLLLVSILRSYEKQGVVELKLENSSAQAPLGSLVGLWQDHRMKESATWHKVYSTHSNFNKIPAGLEDATANLSIRMTKGPRFKIVSVISC